MKKTYKMALMSALTFFSLSASPFVLNDHLNVAQAATTKKTHHKKVRKHTTKKHKVAKRKVTKKKTAKKLRYKKAKKHVAKKKATRKFSYKKVKKHVIKKKFTKKLHYKKAKKVVAKKKATKKRSLKKVTTKKFNHKKSRKVAVKKQHNTNNSVIPQNDALDNNDNTAEQNNFDFDSYINPVEDNTNNNVTPQDNTSNNNDDATKQDDSQVRNNTNSNVTPQNNKSNKDNTNATKQDVTTPNKSDNNDTDDVNNYIKLPSDYPIKFVNGQYQTGTIPASSKPAFNMNHFHANKQDENTIVDFSNLTYQQQKDLSQYAANIINNVRHQISNNNSNIADLTVNDKAINFVNDIIRQYNKDDWAIMDKNNSEDYNAINKVDSEYGLGSTNYFNTEVTTFGGDLMDKLEKKLTVHTNLATLKKTIYQEIEASLFHYKRDSQLSYAYYLIGNDPESSSNNFALGFDGLAQMHFEIIPSFDTKANEEADDQQNTNGNDQNKSSNDLYNNFWKAQGVLSKNIDNNVDTTISANEPYAKQLAMFQAITLSEETSRLANENKSTNLSESLDNNGITINDVDYPNGKKFDFDSSVENFDEMKYSQEVDNEHRQGIDPHISKDQSREKQLVEFETILMDNESAKLTSEKKDNSVQSFINFNNVIIKDADHPNYEVFPFNPDTKLSYGASLNSLLYSNSNEQLNSPLEDKIEKDIQNGTMPHISKDQPHELQFAEFQHIFIANEKNQLNSEGKDETVAYRPEISKNQLIIQDANHPNRITVQFDSKIQRKGLLYK